MGLKYCPGFALLDRWIDKWINKKLNWTKKAPTLKDRCINFRKTKFSIWLFLFD